MRKFTIPPLPSIEPVVDIKPTENGMMAELEYTEDALDEMVRHINKRLDEELMARLAKQHGYVKVRRCEDCRYYRASDATCHSWQWHNWDAAIEVEPDGFCKWGEPKESSDD